MPGLLTTVLSNEVLAPFPLGEIRGLVFLSGAVLCSLYSHGNISPETQQDEFFCAFLYSYSTPL